MCNLARANVTIAILGLAVLSSVAQGSEGAPPVQGSSFQALDYMALADRIGKPVGQDLSDGNVTLPLIHLYRSADEGERQQIRRVFFESNGTPDGKLDSILDMMKKHGAIEYTLSRAADFVERAKASLRELPDNLDPFYRNALIALADYIVERDR